MHILRISLTSLDSFFLQGLHPLLSGFFLHVVSLHEGFFCLCCPSLTLSCINFPFFIAYFVNMHAWTPPLRLPLFLSVCSVRTFAYIFPSSKILFRKHFLFFPTCFALSPLLHNFPSCFQAFFVTYLFIQPFLCIVSLQYSYSAHIFPSVSIFVYDTLFKDCFAYRFPSLSIFGTSFSSTK